MPPAQLALPPVTWSHSVALSSPSVPPFWLKHHSIRYITDSLHFFIVYPQPFVTTLGLLLFV